MVHVIAVITAKPGKREAILEAFRANVPSVRAEKGCIEYGAAIDARARVADPGQVRRRDVRRDREVGSMDALKAHAAAPHMQAYGAKTRELIASRVIHVLSPC